MRLRMVSVAAALAAVFALLPAAASQTPTTRSAGPALAWVRARTPAEVKLLHAFDLGEARHGSEYQVVLWPGDAGRLQRFGLPFRIEVADLEAADRAAGVGDWEPAQAATARTTYRRLQDYESELKQLAITYPDRARLIEAPLKTLEGRTVYGLEIANSVTASDGRPTSFVMGLHHAREWPAAELTMDFARDLITSVASRFVTIRNTVRVLAVPIVNPDGFNHSRESLINEDLDQSISLIGAVAGGQATYWRKNRRAVAHEPESHSSVGSYGVDPNRNYAHQWGGGTLTSNYPASTDPTSQTYQGPGPFSEPETQNVRALVLSHNVTTLLTNHTVAGLVLWPWGHTFTPAPDATALSAIGRAMAAYNHYTPQQSIGLYATTGTTEDWAYAATGAFGYTIELGRYGFHPPYRTSIAPMYLANRGAFQTLVEAAANTAYHSVLTGKVRDTNGLPVDATLRITKTVQTPLWQDGNGSAPVPERSYTDTIDVSTQTGASGDFAWHVNPSTRPIASEPETYTLTITAPGQTTETRTVQVARGQTLDLGTITI